MIPSVVRLRCQMLHSGYRGELGRGAMEAYKIDVVLKQNGTLVLKQLPFKRGEHVEIIVIPAAEQKQEAADAHPLRGTVLRYDDPFAPVAEAEWETLQ